MERAEPERNVHPREAVADENQGDAEQRKAEIKQERNEDIQRELFPVLQKHRENDNLRQDSQNDAQRIERASVVQVFVVEIIEKVRELADDDETEIHGAQAEDYEKMDGYPFFHGIPRRQKNRELQARLLYEFADIKTEEKRHRRIAHKNEKIAEAHHVESYRGGVPPIKVGERIRQEHKAREKFDKDERPPAVLLQLMPRAQKNSRLKAEERNKKKR